MNAQQQKVRLSDVPVIVAFRDYLNMRDKLVAVDGKNYLPNGHQLHPVRIASWGS